MKQPTYARVKRRRFKLDQIEAAPYNARSITQEALRGLGESLARFGVLALPIVNVRHKPPRLVGGHQRVTALKEAGVESVECIVVDFDDTLERQANVALNNPEIEGTFIPSLTRELIAEIAEHYKDQTVPDLRLDSLLKQVMRSVTQADADKVVKVGKVDDDASVVMSQSSSVSKAGRTYALGDHLLHVAKLSKPGTLKPFQVDTSDMVFASMTNLPDDASPDYVDVVLRHALANTTGPLYLSVSPALWPAVQGRFVECGGHWSNLIVVHGETTEPSSKPFNQCCALICYGWSQGAAHSFHGGRATGNTWKMKGKVGVDLPVQAVVDAILHSTLAGQRVLDPICDGGTTIVACEKTGRRLLGIATSPREADRVRRRWTEFVHGKGADWKALTMEV